jgi:adenosylhomocysteine nucleosidase
MDKPRVIVLISANSEWGAVKKILAPAEVQSTRLGEYIDRIPEAGTHGTAIRFFHGGWGKISAATTAQFAIDHWQPDLLINLGTCGGFEGCIARGTIILVTRTIVYDIIEQMSNPDEAVAHYSTEIDLSWLTDEEWLTIDDGRSPVARGLLVSADRDIVPSDIPMLVEKYGAVAADWESGAIAWVAKRNAVRCLILRGVTDLVSASGGEAYGNIDLFHENTKKVMKTMIDQLPGWMDHIRPNYAGKTPLLNKVDCIRLYVPDLESGLAFYRDKLGHDLIWRTPQAAGLRMPGTETEIVIQNEQEGQEVDITVASADEAAQRFADVGGTIVVAPFDIQIGRCTVVCDPWGNHMTFLDTSKGLLVTDESGKVIGNMKQMI